jgi:pimeloyl-ACP methyl ester carboxylesterase
MRIEAGGVPIAFDEVGHGRTAVFLHGNPSCRQQMIHLHEPIFSERSGWRRVYPDLPGMGETPGLDGEATQDAVLEVVGAFVEQVAGDEPIVLVGASYGGHLALGYNHRWGKRLAGLMLSEPAVRIGTDREVPEHTVMVENPDLLAGLPPEEQFFAQLSVVHTPESLEEFRAIVMPGLALADHEYLRRLATRIEYSFDLRTAKPMTAPTLIVGGRQDSVSGYRDLWEIIELFPHATLAILDRAGHAVSWEQRTLFRALIHEFIDRVEEAG